MIRGHRFRDMPIRKRLRAIVLVASGVAVFGNCAVFLTYQWIYSRNALTRQLTIMAQVVGDQCATALEFDQRAQATATLRSLRSERQILVAAIYDREGRLFARYLREGTDPRLLPPHPPAADGRQFERGDLLVHEPLRSGNERIGTFLLRSDRSEAWHRLRIDLAAVGLVLLGAAATSLFLSRRLGRPITEPVQRLAEAVRRVSAERNYAIRVEHGSGDEIGQLIAGFNDMLAQVEARDDALARARDDLEQRVQDRTRELDARMTDLDAVNRELESFSYSVSHDLRAPLRAIGGFARMLSEDYADRLDAEGRRFLAVIGDNTARMGQLIDDLLAFSRLGRQSIEVRPIDMGLTVNEVAREMREHHPDRPLQFDVGELPPAHGDPAMIRQVLVNLLSNAVKYTRGRDPAVIEVGARTEANDTVYYVRDNGVGFEMKYAHKLFGVFQRLHEARDFDGTGVGLALVQRIIQRHGGRVWGEGAVNQGATFYFTLPRAAVGAVV